MEHEYETNTIINQTSSTTAGPLERKRSVARPDPTDSELFDVFPLVCRGAIASKKIK